MSLDDLGDDVSEKNALLGDDVDVSLDRETRSELAMLMAVLDLDEPDDLLRRGVHLLFQSAVDTGKLDFHLRSAYDVTYDEYLSGMTYDEMTAGTVSYPQNDDDRRYQF